MSLNSRSVALFGNARVCQGIQRFEQRVPFSATVERSRSFSPAEGIVFSV